MFTRCMSGAAFRALMVIFAAFALVSAAGATAQATTYNVGPGQTYTNLVDVPWEDLTAGDTVNIYYRATPYVEKFGVFGQGTENSPITIHGVPDQSTGALPVINGDGADSRSSAYLDYWSENRQVIKIGGATIPDTTPSYVVIENLEVKCGRDPYTFTDGDGNPQTYTTNASAIRIEAGDHITIRNCIMHDSANNFLTSGLSEEVVCEGCYIYDGGYTLAEHNIYTESHGITFQYNRLEPLRTSGTASEGINLKDRSARTCVRYNWIEGGVRQVNLVESYDFQTIRDYTGYGTEDRVYGNVLIMNSNANGTEQFLYGGDMGGAYEQYYRSGPLKAYNNTCISRRTDNTRLIRLKTAAQSADMFNNIWYVPSGTAYVLSSSIGTCTTSHNWFTTNTALTGASSDSTDIYGSSPGFTDYSNEDFSLTSNSDCVDAGMAIPQALTPTYDVTQQYVKHQDYESRPNDGNIDIGAYEYSAGIGDLVITTTSLPNAPVNVAYSQNLSATGGVTPYSWSVASGSLPNGLSLSSAGLISGTPTSTGTSNFTVQVTDSQGTPDTDTQALSIVVVTVTEPTYRFVAADAETGTSTTTYVNKATMTFTPEISDDWLIFGFAEFRYSSTSYSGLLRMTIDGTDVAEVSMEPASNVQYLTFSAVKAATLNTSSHTINIDYMSERSGTNNYVRRARILAIRKADLAMATAATESSANLTTTLSAYATLNFTPASSGYYLLVYSGEFQGATTTYSTQVQATLGGNVLDETFVEARDTSDWMPFVSVAVAECAASQQTATVTAAKENGSNATHSIRRARVAAIRLTGGRYASYQYGSSDSPSTTQSTSYVEKLSKSWSVGSTGDWAILSSFRLSGSNTSYQTYGQVQLDNSTVLGESIRRPVDTTDWMSAGCVDLRELTSGTRQVDVDFHASSAVPTAGIKYVHLVALPLE